MKIPALKFFFFRQGIKVRVWGNRSEISPLKGLHCFLWLWILFKTFALKKMLHN